MGRRSITVIEEPVKIEPGYDGYKEQRVRIEKEARAFWSRLILWCCGASFLLGFIAGAAYCGIAGGR
jgi:hypothetical protein